MAPTPIKENTNTNKVVPGEPFLSWVDGMPVEQQLSDAAMCARLDNLRATPSPAVLSPSSAHALAEPAEPADYFDWDVLDGYSLPFDEPSLYGSSSTRPPFPVAPQLRRSASAPALVDTSLSVTASTPKKKERTVSLLSRAHRVLAIPLLRLGGVLRAVGDWVTLPKTDITRTNEHLRTQRYKASESFLFSVDNTAKSAEKPATAPPKPVGAIPEGGDKTPPPLAKSTSRPT